MPKTIAHHWTPEMISTLQTNYSKVGGTACAHLLGLPHYSIYRKAAKLGLKLPTRRPPAPCTVAAQMLELSKRPQGVGHNDCRPHSANAASKAAQSLMKAGLIFKATLSYKCVRYFDTPDKAKAASTYSPTPRGSQPTFCIRTRPGGPGPAYLPGEPVRTATTKVTIAPPPPERLLRTNTHAAH